MVKREYTEKVIAEFLAYKERTVKQSTLRDYEIKTEKYFQILLPEITSRIKKKTFYEIMDFFDEEDLEDKTISDIILLLNQFLAYCYEHNYIKELIKIQNINVKEKKIIIFTRNERSKLKDFLINHLSYFNFAILLVLYSGIRLGELAALKASDFNIEEGTIYINKSLKRIKNKDKKSKKKTLVIIDTPKSASSYREIPLPDFIIELFKKMNYKDNAYIVTGIDKYIDMRTIQRRFKKLLFMLGLPKRKFHVLRHTYATYSLEDGMTIEAVAKLLGHANIKQAEKYVHLTIDYLRKNVDKIDES